jgi:hypothetical protein
MNIRHFKIWAIILALFFSSGCAVFVRDDGFRHHHFHRGRWHSSLQPSDQSAVQMIAQASGDSGTHDKVSR